MEQVFYGGICVLQPTCEFYDVFVIPQRCLDHRNVFLWNTLRIDLDPSNLFLKLSGD